MATVFGFILILWLAGTSVVQSNDDKKTSLKKNTSFVPPGSNVCADVWCSVRLPHYVIPYHYNLHIKADVDQLRFEGQQIAFINLLRQTNTVLFHTKNMNISKVSMTSTNDKSLFDVSQHFAYPKNEFHVVRFAKILPMGRYQLTIHFNANVSKTLTGFYKSSYKENGTERVLLTTKFQPTDARKAFPCFDEPDMKATFNITITHPKEYTARSNMPGVTTTTRESNKWLQTVFPQTVKMSTYLVGFVVSKFESKFEGLSGVDSNVKVAIWSRPEYVDITKYAFEMSIKMLTFLEEFLNVKYTLPKLDMFAIPDYASGATEHWGIITYREARLLYKPGQTSLVSKKHTSSLIAHEMAHLWFGNLVTCKWWNDLWVQEGMASYLEYYLLEEVHPEWNVTDSYLTDEVLPGLRLDALQSSHPLSQPLTHPKQIKEIFDTITYRKGASLFGMLDSFLGKEVFRKGLNVYLTTHKYGGATVDDIWDALAKVSDIDVKKMMDTWTKQMGFPLITISRIDKDTFSLSQERFVLRPDPEALTHSEYNYQWIIPFIYAENNNLETPKTIVVNSMVTTITSSSDWLIGNYRHRGFYRVNYDNEGWENIITQFENNHMVFSVTDRAGILDDAYSLALSGKIPYSIPFRLSRYLRKETGYVIWKVFMKNMLFLDTVLSSQDYYGTFRSWYAERLTGRVKTHKIPRLIKTACRVGEKSVIAFVQWHFKAWMENGTMIPKNMRKSFYFCAIANGGDKEWNFIYQKYMTATNPSERSNLLHALSASQKPWILNKWLRYSLDSRKVRSQDMVYVIRNIAQNNPLGKVYAWKFAEDNWEKMMGIAKENNFHMNVLVLGLTSRFTTESYLRRVERLWKKYPDAGSGKGARKQGIEYIKANIDWLRRNSNMMGNLLKEN